MSAYRSRAYHALDRTRPPLNTKPMGKRVALLVAAACAVYALAAAPSTASAQGYGGPGYYPGAPPPAPPPGIIRSGLIVGGAVGLGGIFDADCDDCSGLGAFGLQFHIGGMIAPNLALVFDMSGLYHVFDDDSILTSATFLGVIRGWLGRIFWLEAGLGLGYLEATDAWGYTEGSRTGGAALVGAGIEVLQTPSFALDIQLRISGARFSAGGNSFGISNVGVFVGFNWY
jgi:hypothetical protein